MSISIPRPIVAKPVSSSPEGDKPSAQDFQSKGPVLADELPPARSKEELKAEMEKLNQK